MLDYVLVAASLPNLSLSDWTVLGVVSEAPTHGWPVVRALRGDGELGKVWTVARPVVYRSLATLTAGGLIEEYDELPGERGPQRTMVRATRKGRGALRRWLGIPVEHVRDVRTEFLVKVAFLERAGQPIDALVTAQLDALQPVLDAVAGRPAGEGFDLVLAQWRREQALAVDRFLRALL
ncbi:MAG TPA: PadR family transcriptional regulator [Acidimicrobiia bacterium]|nr:PadR family transcriptional regulator [Acidimicrobiia bacterium]